MSVIKNQNVCWPMPFNQVTVSSIVCWPNACQPNISWPNAFQLIICQANVSWLNVYQPNACQSNVLYSEDD